MIGASVRRLATVTAESKRGSISPGTASGEIDRGTAK
jgi:hypothetical protein